MSAIQSFIQRARQDLPVFISEVREAFSRGGQRRICCRFSLYDGSARDFELRFPELHTPEEEAFAVSYLHATLYNALSVLGAKRVDLYADEHKDALYEALAGLNAFFQVDLPLARRSAWGKCLNVNERTLKALFGTCERFQFHLHPLSGLKPAVDAKRRESVSGLRFEDMLASAGDKVLMGMDIGGTDIKIAVSVKGRLCLFKEYDWFPAAFSRAEQLISPILLLTRLMRAAACLVLAGKEEELQHHAFSKTAGAGEMEQACEAMERAAGPELTGFDAIGLCFPDVVIKNRIVGGETYKTRGMREQTALDYEEEFAKITGLCDLLARYVRPGGAVMNINDGPMAAFTTAMEEARAGADLGSGFFAHTLGTELGTGWLLPDGSIPEIPLEAYNFIIDLGSFGQRAYQADDIRSVLNFNTGLPGTLQKYASQSGVFRLAAKLLPDEDSAVYEEAFSLGYFKSQGDKLLVPTSPKDMRKPCLEFFMKKAENRDSACAEIFRQVGVFMAVTWLETQYLLEPECRERTLYGRLVKSAACFDLITEGARHVVRDIRLSAADDSLVSTPLMKQLQAHPDYSVAQFAQAVGAVYYGCSGLIRA